MRTRPWDFGGLSAKTRNWVGLGDDHDTVSEHPEQILHTLARTHHTPLQKHTLLPLRVLVSPSHVQLASLFLMFIRSRASGFRSVSTFWAAAAFCTVYTVFSYYPTTCGLAVSSRSSLQLQRFGACASASFAVVTDTCMEPEPLHLLQLSQLGSLEAATAQPGWSKCSW